MKGIRERIIDRFPDPTPRDLLTAREEHEFEVVETSGGPVTKTVYPLDKAPVENLISVEFGRTTLTPPDQVELRDTDGDGKDDALAFLDDSVYPEDGEEFTIVYRAVPIIHRFTRASTTDTHEFADRVDGAVDETRVDTATGTNLEELGAIYGRLGLRRGRNDTAYRTHLRSLRAAFTGRGTKPGVKRVVAEALQTDEDNITITEDYEQVGYSVTVDTPETGLLTGSLSELLELADPSGVELLSEPVVSLQGATVTAGSSPMSVTDIETGGLGDGVLGDGTL